jgi:hypothetical protein
MSIGRYKAGSEIYTSTFVYWKLSPTNITSETTARIKGRKAVALISDYTEVRHVSTATCLVPTTNNDTGVL